MSPIERIIARQRYVVPAMEERTGTVCYRHPDRATRLSCTECERPICIDCSNDAAVGQKCPECSKQVGRARVIDARRTVRGPTFETSPVTFSIIAITAAIFVLGFLSAGLNDRLFDELALIKLAVRDGEWWRALSAALLHGSVMHILFNMYALYLFGPPLERRVGSAAFSGLYVASALAGSAAFLFFGSDRALAMGASGAVFGLFGAVLMATWPVRHTALGGAQFQQLLVLLGINLALPLFLPSIAWQAHVGGMVAGMLIVGMWQRIPQGPQKKAQQTAVAYAVAGIGFALFFLG